MGVIVPLILITNSLDEETPQLLATCFRGDNPYYDAVTGAGFISENIL